MLAMSDIIERIKGLRYIHVPQASQLFQEAIAEIERLRLTDAERAAMEWAVIRLANSGEARVGVAMDDTLAAQRLRKILERHASERRTEVK